MVASTCNTCGLVHRQLHIKRETYPQCAGKVHSSVRICFYYFILIYLSTHPACLFRGLGHLSLKMQSFQPCSSPQVSSRSNQTSRDRMLELSVSQQSRHHSSSLLSLSFCVATDIDHLRQDRNTCCFLCAAQ